MLVYPIPKGCHGDRSEAEPPYVFAAAETIRSFDYARHDSLRHRIHLRGNRYKHLRVLERAEIVCSTRSGRKRLFEFNPRPILGIKRYLDLASRQWDQALARLQSLVEG